MIGPYKSLVGDASKLVVIPNGFDDHLMSKLNSSQSNRTSSDTLKLIYTGSYYLDHQPDFIFKAIQRAIEKDSRLVGKIVFNLYGSIDDRTKALIEKYSPVFTIHYHSYVERDLVFTKMLDSDLGVISFPPTRWSIDMIPSKVYEYKKLNIPLLIIGEKDSALQGLAAEWEESFYHAVDAESIADFLIAFSVSATRRRSASADNNTIDEYSYSRLRERFVNLFK